MHVVIVGTMFGNKTIHGPFYDFDRAFDWVESDAKGQNYEIVPLETT